MSLEQEIAKMRTEIRTDGYPMSIGEWISLYERGEIDIHPEFQRFYRWSDVQKANFIDSILLGIPIPPIFVSQRPDGVWDVVDGLQRLSTIYQLLGILKDENNNLVEPLTLEKTKYLPSLEGKRWDDKTDVGSSFPQEIKLLFKRTKISASIILKESDEKSKYELFQRLNTGGSRLTEQEVRNCILVMINKEMYARIKSLADSKAFQETVVISERLIEEQYDLELVLRFLIFVTIATSELSQIRDLGAFLTAKMISIAEDNKFDFNSYEEIFQKTFGHINKNIGSDAFRRYNKAKRKFLGAFSVSAFEVIAMGIGYNFGSSKFMKKNISKDIKELWNNKEFSESSGMGMSSSRRVPKLIPLGRKIFSP
jgi:uncharacterized protein with ParB-like and HNH nuclease domain